MDETLKRIGLELRRTYHFVIRRHVDWKIIDAVSRLEEREEEDAQHGQPASQAPVRPPGRPEDE